MELKSCGTVHYIQTIRGGLVMKVQNIKSNGRPVIKTKSLNDVYKDADAKIPHSPTSSMAIDHGQVKRENWADRTLQDINEFVPRADDNGDSGSDDDITLTQLKRRFSTKKRKHVLSDELFKQDSADCKPVEDESDLDVPIINLKAKRSKASKAKRKRMNLSVVSSSAIDFAVKSEENSVSEGSPQVVRGQAPVTCVKVEVPETEQLGSQIETPSDDAPSTGELASNEFPEMVQCEYGETLPCADKYQDCYTNEISYDHLEGIEPISMIVPWDEMSVKLESMKFVSEEHTELSPLASEKKKETTDEDSCIRSLSDDSNVELSPLASQKQKETTYEDSCIRSLSDDSNIELSPLASEKQKETTDDDSCIRYLSDDPNSDMCSHSRSFFNMEDISEQRSSSGIQVSDMDIDCIDGCMGLNQESIPVLLESEAEAGLTNELDEVLSSPTKNCHSDPDSIISLTTDENLVPMEDTDEEQPSARSFDSMNTDVLNCENELLKPEKTQILASPIIDAERLYLSNNQPCDSDDAISTSEPHQPPERLHSTRKAISPSSQERLRLVMNSVEIVNDADQNIVSECKSKNMDKQTVKKPSSPGSDIQHDEITVNGRQSGKVSQRKAIRSPRSIRKKSEIAKGNFESSRFSRTLPNLSTGCTSVEGCSESAIAFSQRQMHDMESLSMKLMSELKSMKDIVEQKLLFEAYRNVSLKNDADEVKLAISNATKVEGTARKWLSIMARDCNRFCKIMELTPNSTAISSDTVPREKRKIVFADEAGEKLCHVRFFEDESTSPASDVAEQ